MRRFFVQLLAASLMLVAGSSLAAERNEINGMLPMWQSSSTLLVGSGVARDSTDSANISVTSPTTVTFSDLTGLNRRDTGLQSTGFWHLYAVGGSSSSGFLLSQSTTSPTLPSGITTFRRLPFAIFNRLNGFADIRMFVVSSWSSSAADISFPEFTNFSSGSEFEVLQAGTATSFTAVSVNNLHTIIPTNSIGYGSGVTANVTAHMGFWGINNSSSSNNSLRVRPTGTTAGEMVPCSVSTNDANDIKYVDVPLGTGSQIDYRWSSSGANVWIYVTGYSISFVQ